jgi:hypothetical protein
MSTLSLVDVFHRAPFSTQLWQMREKNLIYMYNMLYGLDKSIYTFKERKGLLKLLEEHDLSCLYFSLICHN